MAFGALEGVICSSSRMMFSVVVRPAARKSTWPMPLRKTRETWLKVTRRPRTMKDINATATKISISENPEWWSGGVVEFWRRRGGLMDWWIDGLVARKLQAPRGGVEGW